MNSYIYLVDCQLGLGKMWAIGDGSTGAEEGEGEGLRTAGLEELQLDGGRS